MTAETPRVVFVEDDGYTSAVPYPSAIPDQHVYLASDWPGTI